MKKQTNNKKYGTCFHVIPYIHSPRGGTFFINKNGDHKHVSAKQDLRLLDSQISLFMPLLSSAIIHKILLY